ncbi:MAG: hypothetical protein MJZ98_02790 [Paludibacteraceae bacterium]|nr:hypothetical protein [Paludibacteraceae bacterium]
MVIHIDCNNFFASCETRFCPELKQNPVVVAGITENGGGIVLALNKLAKSLGLKRGDPLFRVQNTLFDHNVLVFPAHVSKYRLISSTIISMVRSLGVVCQLTQYSVDEFFGLVPTDNPVECRRIALQLKDYIARIADIPVSCGLASTKTLAKVATYMAKHYEPYEGVCVLQKHEVADVLATVSVSDIWGVGRANSHKLSRCRVSTAYELFSLNEIFVRGLMGTQGYRTWMELHGIDAVPMTTAFCAPNHMQSSVMQSRTFAYATSDRRLLEETAAKFAAVCTQTLRFQHSECRRVSLFLETNRFDTANPRYVNGQSFDLSCPTALGNVVSAAVVRLFNAIFLPRYKYKRMGVVLSVITPEQSATLPLFPEDDAQKWKHLSTVVDSINKKYGCETIHYTTHNNACFTALMHNDTLDGFAMPDCS